MVEPRILEKKPTTHLSLGLEMLFLSVAASLKQFTQLADARRATPVFRDVIGQILH
jgi:hypothetical protein